MTGPLSPLARVRRWAVAGLIVNGSLAVMKIGAGVLGNSYALIADGVESLTDIASSIILWTGLRYADRPPDDRFPYGYGKAEALTALVVAAMLAGAALGIAVQAVREILTPHHSPKPFTLAVLVTVVIVKESMFRLARRAARAGGSSAGEADAWHHRSDAITSAFAFIGISAALLGGEAWAPADDWAALLASAVILWNAGVILRAPLADLLDADSPEIVEPARRCALALPGVLGVEKLRARRSGGRFWLELHLEVDPQMAVRDAHALGGRVRASLRENLPRVADRLIHTDSSPARPLLLATPAHPSPSAPPPLLHI
ncbi:MAG: cation transporter, partial [Phycisphaerales bacterium]|nr:cation transporter [Phycisphaerales bacterium]